MSKMNMGLKPILLAGGLVAGLTVIAAAQTNGSPERFTAMAVNMSRGGAGTVEIVVNRWSTDAEREKLMSTLLNKGDGKLLSVLQDMPRVGYFRTPNSLGYDIHYAHRETLPEGGERVVLATDRRIGFWEAANQPRSIDYPFTVIEMRLNKDGEGEGKMSLATKIMANKNTNTVVLENYDIQPVLLQGIRRVKASQ
ncbi:MAG TPA: hypothetical protein VGJ29_07110 [Vicinamibacterales bacterium]|jgi:hypothetical protein